VISRPVLAYKLRAALISLSVFALFSVALGLLAWHYWFPGYLFWLDGGLQGLKIVLAVDFVLGPLLALVFFHPEKSRNKLVFDIVVIVTLQVGAMGWGAWQVWSQRPVAVVYGNQRFISVAPGIMKLQGESPRTLARFSTDTPPLIYRRETRDRREQQRLMTMLMRYGFHPESQAWLFEPFPPNRERVFDLQAEIRAHVRKELAGAWQDWVAGRAEPDLEAYRLAFYEGRYGSALLVFSQEGHSLGYLSLGDTPLPDLAPAVARPVSR
jgi:hypothetical protein